MNQSEQARQLAQAELLRKRLEEQVQRISKRSSESPKRRVAVKSPYGGYRMEVRVLKVGP